MIYHVKCYETVNFTVAIEAESPSEAEELALEDINSHEVISESVTDWNIEEIIPESEEWYAS
jgi:ribosomal protein L20A (L18A)|tara:strand:- start:543 stop:728 length:186 start_codon:yes stop_codon:yes gene_type:complete